MKLSLRILFFYLLLICALPISGKLYAQTIPANLSSVNVDDLTDAQLSQLLQQASSSGLSDSQIIQNARQRGMNEGEATKLQKRLKDLRRNQIIPGNKNSSMDSTSSVRRLNYEAGIDTVSKYRPQDVFLSISPKIFGADIFSNSNPAFAPNLKLATPVNYIVGPDDQLNINIYGNSLTNWKLDVSPEGNINIPGVGLVNVTGKTIEQATSTIRQRLIANRYAIGNGTNLQVSLGNIRSIKVIMVGELKRPGTFTLPSLATAFNALYAAGGPNDNGSYRQIEIIRNNRIVRTLDVYDFLTRGDQKNNIGLQDQDIIRVPSYRTRVQLSGEVKNPALFETLPGESFSDVLRFAGGFTNLAYTARIKIIQVADQQRRVTDITDDDFKNYMPLRGDKYIVDRILERFTNRVTIAGSVFRPGSYELAKGQTLSGLVTKAAGLTEDAFGSRVAIFRVKPDNTKELLSVNLQQILKKQSPDILLQREDSVVVTSSLDLRDKYQVTIQGQVRRPGQFAFAEGMSVADLIVIAGGFTEAASSARIEVSRRIDNSAPMAGNGQVVQIFSVDLDKDLNMEKAGFVLQPFDIVSIYALPGYQKQRTVKIEGEVQYPGYYTLKTLNEKISSVIGRAGNLTAVADANGSSLRRNNSAILGIDKTKIDSTALQQERIDKINRLSGAFRDSSNRDIEIQSRNNYIGIDLSEILKKPGSKTDLILEDGDVIRVPKQQQIVRVNGEVLYPSAVVFDKGKSFNDFVSNAGGYSPQALKRGAYVVYPNGTVNGTRKFLFFNVHPAVKPGSEIYVPKKPEKRGNSTQEFIGITTALASLGAIILGIISLRR